MIQGMDDMNVPVVRFVITSEAAQCDYSFSCKRVEGEKNKWCAKLPALLHVKESTVKFHVEVIVDGYYFEPAQGSVTLVTDPTVKFTPSVSKPTVTTSFTVRQEPDEKKDEEDEEITGQYAPTNALLKPEFPPPETHVANKDDEHVDYSKIDAISSEVVPGEGDPYPPRAPDEGDEDDFDPRRVAESIVRKTFGSGAAKPATQGTLFKRDKDGKTVIEGLDSPAGKAEKALKAAKVREILGKK